MFSSAIRLWVSGLGVGLLGPVIITLATAAYWPETAFLGTVARILESVAPQGLVACMGACVILFLLGARRTALALVAAACLGMAGIAQAHLSRALPLVPDRPSDLSLIWFNALWTSTTPPEQVAQAIRDSGADMVILAEALQFDGVRDGLRDVYPHQLGCRVQCEIIVFSKLPFRTQAVIDANFAWPERLAIIAPEVPGHAPVTLVAMHLMKPWFYGITQHEEKIVTAALAELGGPTIVVGDLNSAPWSRRLYLLHDRFALQAARRALPTWPKWLGRLAVPIDHVLVRDGPRLVSLAPWGEDLGSDHVGIRADFALP